MTPEERARIERAADAAADAAPPLSPALRNHLNTVMGDAMRAVMRRHEESPDAEVPRHPTGHRARRDRSS
jgi:hypothetical protein